MAKKRNYGNDEAFKNFRIEDYLPEMKRRDSEVKAYVQEETALFPSMDEPDAPAMQDTVSDADRTDKLEIRDAPDGETAEKNATEDAGVPAGRTVARWCASMMWNGTGF